ncbi:MAG: DegT/DnrJ/EryC1/StrS aminotransferase family protein [Truepera sp.]|jgi:dTDP-4-amino-4,6-dideoxygalactose transaminase|nr:DegT/DnrJ/EryC1/StrS aminotransferase family protein [Truepera sp.]
MSTVLTPPNIDWAPWPTFNEEQVQAVADVLRSGRVNQWTGSEVREFEKDYASYLGRAHAVAVMNGTAALELALKALGVGAGDEVITTPRTFIASASSAVLQGATPVFADVDRDSGNITADTIEKVITPRTKAIIVVHLGGWPADMDAIMRLARANGILVIEDCAQAHGASHKGRPVGSFGDAAAFSFCQDKIITTGGEGGMVALDDEAAWNVAWSYKDHGKSYDAVFHREHAPGFRWLHESFGTNWRMTEIQAVLGRLQLRDLPETLRVRNENAKILREALAEQPALRIPAVEPPDIHAYYKFYVYVVPEALKDDWSRDRVQVELNATGVPVTSGSCSEIYNEVAFTALNMNPAEPLPFAKELGETSLMFQVHPGLAEASLRQAADAVNDVLARATR